MVKFEYFPFRTPPPPLKKNLYFKKILKRTSENFLWAIKNVQKYLMDHQFMPKIFDSLCKNPPPLLIYVVYGLK